jgi:hypothetical protein
MSDFDSLNHAAFFVAWAESHGLSPCEVGKFCLAPVLEEAAGLGEAALDELDVERKTKGPCLWLNDSRRLTFLSARVSPTSD